MTIVVVTPEDPTPVVVTPAGPRGPAGTIAIDEVVTLPAGEPATVENVGTESQAIFNFGIPAGPAPVLTFDTTITGAPGSPADVDVTEIDPGQYELTFTVPEGQPGLNGVNAYLYIGYASDDAGTDFTTTFDIDLDWIAFLRTTSPIMTPEASDFAGLWKNTRGPTGPMPVFDIGIVTTVAPGSPADVEIVETSPGVYEINFDIPEGEPGDLGTAMMKTMYDPTNVAGDVFDMDNMVEGATTKIMTAAERAKVAEFPARGTINTLQTVQEIAWATGAVRWRWTIEADGSLGLRFYDAAGTIISKYGWDQSGFFTTPAGIKIFDASGDALTITLGSTLTAGRNFVIRTADANTDVTFPSSGHLMREFQVGAPLTATGASVTLTGLDCDDLLLSGEGVSHNDGSSRAFNLLLSSDGGSTFPITLPLSGSVSAATVVSGIVLVTGLRQGLIAAFRSAWVNGSDLNAVLNGTVMTYSMVKATGRVNAIRIQPTAGSFDAGLIYVSQRG